jgi:hypothetical protein
MDPFAGIPVRESDDKRAWSKCGRRVYSPPPAAYEVGKNTYCI